MPSFFHLCGAVVSLQVLKIHPIHLNGIQLLRIVGSNHHHPSGSNHVAKFDDVPAKLWLVGGFWGSNPCGKKICQKASSDWIISPQRMKKKVWKQNLGELSSLFCCRIPLLDQRFLSLMFWRDTFLPKKTLAWTITQLFYSTVKENFFKKEKRMATTTVWSDFCLTTTFLVTIKGTS